MNLDEFLKKCAHYSSNLRFDDWPDECEAMEKLIDLVRKLREQRDSAIDAFYSQQVLRESCKGQLNADLDEIVREG